MKPSRLRCGAASAAGHGQRSGVARHRGWLWPVRGAVAGVAGRGRLAPVPDGGPTGAAGRSVTRRLADGAVCSSQQQRRRDGEQPHSARRARRSRRLHPADGPRRRSALATGFEGGRFPAELLRGTPFRSYVGAPTVYLPQVEGLARVTRTGVLVDPPRWDWQSWPCRR